MEKALMMKLLLVEDEDGIADFISRGLRNAGYQVEIAKSAEKALEMMRDSGYAALIVDVMLPLMDGMALCKKLRESGSTEPILLVTALGDVSDKVRGLDSGADDYMTKPFEFSELLARIRALTRKSSGYPRAAIQIADLYINPADKVVSRSNTILDLSKKEYELLEYLARNQERLVTRAMISQAVWNSTTATYTNIIDVFITHLRKKVDSGFDVKLIHTVRGKGFMLSDHSAEQGTNEAP